MKKSKATYSLILFYSIISHYVSSQTTVEARVSNNIELIERVKDYCVAELNMDVSKYFFTDFSKSEYPNYYLYVSRNDTIVGDLDGNVDFKAFGHDPNEAHLEKLRYENQGVALPLLGHR